ESHLRFAVPRQRRNTSRSRSRSETPRRRNRLLHRAAYLQSKTRTPSPCPLRHSRWWLSLDHTHWVKSRDRFFLPIHVLRRVFRGKFVAALRQAFGDHQLVFHGKLTLLAQPRTFAAWLRSLFRKDWVVYSKPPFGGPEYVLQYLGRYTHRV